MVDRLVNSEANTRRIANVESCFGSSGQPLAIPGRVLVGEGVLIKSCRKKPKPRQFFLFNDVLVYGTILISKRKFNKQHIIPLEEVKLEDLSDDGELKNGWLIKTRTKSFAVFAATSSEKREWMLHIERCVADILKNGKQRVTDHAAVWTPDSEAPTCQRCNETQFTLIVRRHHCRKCGAVVCDKCSNKRFLLPSISRRPVRVCADCYSTLTALQPTNAGDSRVSGDINEDSSGEENSDEEEGNNTTNDHPINEEATFYGNVSQNGN